MILDRELDGARLADALGSLVRDPERRARMATQARAFGIPDAAERVADECMRLARA
jgi:UDP-N-acetylglucosamine--N-acetylmuramyl-(pentapeptide) pyrophosphoryl-undecaprenol N-acetylglucosamine transferase